MQCGLCLLLSKYCILYYVYRRNIPNMCGWLHVFLCGQILQSETIRMVFVHIYVYLHFMHASKIDLFHIVNAIFQMEFLT